MTKNEKLRRCFESIARVATEAATNVESQDDTMLMTYLEAIEIEFEDGMEMLGHWAFQTLVKVEPPKGWDVAETGCE